MKKKGQNSEGKGKLKEIGRDKEGKTRKKQGWNEVQITDKGEERRREKVHQHLLRNEGQFTGLLVSLPPLLPVYFSLSLSLPCTPSLCFVSAYKECLQLHS